MLPGQTIPMPSWPWAHCRNSCFGFTEQQSREMDEVFWEAIREGIDRLKASIADRTKNGSDSPTFCTKCPARKIL